MSRALSNTVDDLKFFENFSKSKLVIEHLRILCITNNLRIDKDKVYEFQTLPIHEVDIATNTLLIHKKVAIPYLIYRTAITILKSVDLGDIQHEISKMMLLDMKFGEFAINKLKAIDKNASQEIQLEQSQKATKAIIKKAETVAKKNNIPELYFNLLSEDLS